MFTIKGQTAKDILQRLNNPTKEEIEKAKAMLTHCHELAKSITVRNPIFINSDKEETMNTKHIKGSVYGINITEALSILTHDLNGEILKLTIEKDLVHPRRYKWSAELKEEEL